MNHTEFEQLVLDALEYLPAQFLPFLNNVEIIIEPRMTPALRRRFELGPKEIVYGIYEGIPLPERDSHDTYLPDTITIFQEPLVRDFPAPDELREEVRRTVLHELGHHLGISDERLEELGAY
jgi:predicted Zn-dependent protease with MMP-like domain